MTTITKIILSVCAFLVSTPISLVPQKAIRKVIFTRSDNFGRNDFGYH